MGDDLKKSVFGGYSKKNIEEIVENLSNELSITKSEMIKQNQHTEKLLSENRVRLANYEAEIEIKTNIVNQLRNQIELQDKEIQVLNHNLDDQSIDIPSNSNAINNNDSNYTVINPNPENQSTLNNTIIDNAILDQYKNLNLAASETIQKIVEEAQKCADDFMCDVYEKIIDSENELNKIKSAAIDSKTNIVQHLEQIKQQFLSLQDHLIYVSDEELALAETTKYLAELKENTINTIGKEIQDYTLKSSSFTQQINENISQALAQAQARAQARAKANAIAEAKAQAEEKAHAEAIAKAEAEAKVHEEAMTKAKAKLEALTKAKTTQKSTDYAPKPVMYTPKPVEPFKKPDTTESKTPENAQIPSEFIPINDAGSISSDSMQNLQRQWQESRRNSSPAFATEQSAPANQEPQKEQLYAALNIPYEQIIKEDKTAKPQKATVKANDANTESDNDMITPEYANPKPASLKDILKKYSE